MSIFHNRRNALASLSAAALLACLVNSPDGIAASTAKRADVGDTQLTYAEEGSGEPVVFVHPVITDLRIWDKVRQALAGKFHTIAYTQRYHGTDPWSDKGERYGTATQVDDLTAFIKSLNVGPVHLVGWSSGGTVATVTALKNPELVQSLAVYEPGIGSLLPEGEAGRAAKEDAGKMFDPSDEAVRAGDAERATRLLVEGVFLLPPGGYDKEAQWIKAVWADNARTIMLGFNAPSTVVTCEMLEALNKPVLIMRGENASPFFATIAKVMGECLPADEEAVLPKVNHDALLRDPASFSAALTEFLEKQR